MKTATRRSRDALLLAITWMSVGLSSAPVRAQTNDSITLRGHEQKLHIYGTRGGDPVVVSSGDGGWIHLAPHVAELLARHGFFVVGFDVRSYLTSFTAPGTKLNMQEEPSDYQTLVEFAAKGTSKQPILIGVSEGAGLSVLAATNPRVKPMIAGVIGLGLPDRNELGWRWKDAIIYLTHTIPNEPTFSTRAIVDQVSPVPLVAIHSSHDEFVPVSEVEQIMAAAREPKKLWVVPASDHRFSSSLAQFDAHLIDAITWIQTFH